MTAETENLGMSPFYLPSLLINLEAIEPFGAKMSKSNSPLSYVRQIAIGAASGLLLLVLIIGGFTLAAPSAEPTSSATNTPTDSPTVTPTASGRDCSVAELAADKRLLGLHAQVMNPATNEVLFDILGDTPAQTASVMKLLTAAAALQVLGPNFRVQTKVYADIDLPGQIVIIGAGDPTLSRVGVGKQSVYADAPKLSDLAVQINKWARATPINSIVLDSTYFPEPGWEPGVDDSERTIGYQSIVTALQVDGDRDNPTRGVSARSADPVDRVGVALKKAIGPLAEMATLTQAKAGTNLLQIGVVQSQPISKWISHMLQVSDNTEAEYLARLVSKQLGYDGSFSSIDVAIKSALTSAGLVTTGLNLKDGSGENEENQVPATFINALLKKILNGEGNFGIIKQALPVAGESGSLANRFKGDNIDAAGHILAKTGWTRHEYSLAGIIMAKDGTDLVFSIAAIDANIKDTAKEAIDNLATGIYRCGDKLSAETTPKIK
jgi:D-alanyl-D-alanine carboxypeptidase/D-alanyl-D-alanine-endopeptidase (penicillin-binding protein 4)